MAEDCADQTVVGQRFEVVVTTDAPDIPALRRATVRKLNRPGNLGPGNLGGLHFVRGWRDNKTRSASHKQPIVPVALRNIDLFEALKGNYVIRLQAVDIQPYLRGQR